jgi:hypothetical protein
MIQAYVDRVASVKNDAKKRLHDIKKILENIALWSDKNQHFKINCFSTI